MLRLQTPDPETVLYTIEEVAQEVGLSTGGIRQMLRRNPDAGYGVLIDPTAGPNRAIWVFTDAHVERIRNRPRAKLKNPAPVAR